jgi:transcriptional regulator GlxA family with amidase domain
MKTNRIEQPNLTGRNPLASHTKQRGKAESLTAMPSDKGGHRQDMDSLHNPPITLLGADDRSDIAKKIEQSIAYMAQHLNEPVPVAALAAQACLSPSHYFALFKRQTGSTPMRYFTHLRLQYACHLLDTTSSPVKEIADALGYKDQFYFSRVFKLVNHMAPSEYRLRQQGQKKGRVVF